MQSTLYSQLPIRPLHVAIIMDGNGRWAARRGLPRTAGHTAGIEAIRRVVEAAPEVGIGTLSLFAFSADNWRRPAAEVGALMDLLRLYLRRETRQLAEAGARLAVIGRRDRLPEGLPDAIAAAERATAGGRRLDLRIAVDYSSRDAILAAASACGDRPSRATLAAQLGRSAPAVDVDLLIRTGGERRLSDFLLWECAYAELHFTDCAWPDFDAAALDGALAEFRRRDRRFGGLGQPHAAAVA